MTGSGVRRVACGAATLALVGTTPAGAHGAGALGAENAAIQTSQYSIDLTQGPVLAGSRVTGLSGAYVALAEGVDGDVQTPATPAVRPAYSVDDFDFDLGLGFTSPSALRNTDFFNTGRSTQLASSTDQQRFVHLLPTINLAWGDVGVGMAAELQAYNLRRTSDAATPTDRGQLGASFAVVHPQLAHAFLDQQLVIGVGLRLSTMSVTNETAPPGQQDLFTTAGTGYELGIVIKPTNQQVRLGAALRSAVSTAPSASSLLTPNAEGDRIVGGSPGDASLASDPNVFYLPNRVVIPWDLNVGVAFQLGPRPLNPSHTTPDALLGRSNRHRRRRAAERAWRASQHLQSVREQGGDDEAAERALTTLLEQHAAIDDRLGEREHAETLDRLRSRYRALPRRYLLVTASMLVTGAAADAVGIESFLQGRVARSGTVTTWSPRLGLETEALPDRLKLRLGTYSEPTRFLEGSARQHGTFGLTALLLPWSVFGLAAEGTPWALSAAVDAAPRYLGWTVSIGVWH